MGFWELATRNQTSSAPSERVTPYSIFEQLFSPYTYGGRRYDYSTFQRDINGARAAGLSISPREARAMRMLAKHGNEWYDSEGKLKRGLTAAQANRAFRNKAVVNNFYNLIKPKDKKSTKKTSTTTSEANTEQTQARWAVNNFINNGYDLNAALKYSALSDFTGIANLWGASNIDALRTNNVYNAQAAAAEKAYYDKLSAPEKRAYAAQRQQWIQNGLLSGSNLANLTATTNQDMLDYVRNNVGNWYTGYYGGNGYADEYLEAHPTLDENTRKMYELYGITPVTPGSGTWTPRTSPVRTSFTTASDKKSKKDKKSNNYNGDQDVKTGYANLIKKATGELVEITYSGGDYFIGGDKNKKVTLDEAGNLYIGGEKVEKKEVNIESTKFKLGGNMVKKFNEGGPAQNDTISTEDQKARLLKAASVYSGAPLIEVIDSRNHWAANITDADTAIVNLIDENPIMKEADKEAKRQLYFEMLETLGLLKPSEGGPYINGKPILFNYVSSFRSPDDLYGKTSTSYGRSYIPWFGKTISPSWGVGAKRSLDDYHLIDVSGNSNLIDSEGNVWAEVNNPKEGQGNYVVIKGKNLPVGTFRTRKIPGSGKSFSFYKNGGTINQMNYKNYFKEGGIVYALNGVKTSSQTYNPDETVEGTSLEKKIDRTGKNARFTHVAGNAVGASDAQKVVINPLTFYQDMQGNYVANPNASIVSGGEINNYQVNGTDSDVFLFPDGTARRLPTPEHPLAPLPKYKADIPVSSSDNTSTKGSALHSDFGNTKGGLYGNEGIQGLPYTGKEAPYPVDVLKDQVNGRVKVTWTDQYGHIHQDPIPAHKTGGSIAYFDDGGGLAKGMRLRGLNKTNTKVVPSTGGTNVTLDGINNTSEDTELTRNMKLLGYGTHVDANGNEQTYWQDGPGASDARAYAGQPGKRGANAHMSYGEMRRFNRDQGLGMSIRERHAFRRGLNGNERAGDYGIQEGYLAGLSNPAPAPTTPTISDADRDKVLKYRYQTSYQDYLKLPATTATKTFSFQNYKALQKHLWDNRDKFNEDNTLGALTADGKDTYSGKYDELTDSWVKAYGDYLKKSGNAADFNAFRNAVLGITDRTNVGTYSSGTNKGKALSVGKILGDELSNTRVDNDETKRAWYDWYQKQADFSKDVDQAALDEYNLRNKTLNLLGFKNGGTMNKYRQGGAAPQNMQAQVVQLVLAAMGGDEQATQTINKFMKAAEAGDQQAMQIAQMIQAVAQQMQGQAQGQAAAAKHGAKLNYIHELATGCPAGTEPRYYRDGGHICKTCVEKAKKAMETAVETNKCGGKAKKKYFSGDSIDKAACGKKVTSNACSSKVVKEACGGKPKKKKCENGGILEQLKALYDSQH